MLSLGAAALVAASAAPAMAADYYVDQDVPDTGPNLCTQAQPCDSIGDALTLADDDPASADTIHVGRSPSPYGPVTVPSMRVTMLGGEYNAGPDGAATVVDGNNAPGFALVTSSLPRTIEGFTIRGGDTGPFSCSLQASGGSSSAVTVQQNVFDETSAQLDGFICLNDSPSIIGNKVLGDTGGAADPVEGIEVTGAARPEITGNTVQGVDRGVVLSGTTTSATVTDNNLFVRGINTTPSAGIYLDGVTGDIGENRISMDPATTQSGTFGIYAANSSSGGTLGLSRNTIRGFSISGGRGVSIDTPDAVVLDSNMIAENFIGALVTAGSAPSVTVTNDTLWNNSATDLSLFNTPATVDSSILGTGAVGAAACTSSFSRGPSGSVPCGPFATSATPSFVKIAAGDYHLTPGGNGALIERGDPANPPLGALDIDGQARAIDFDGDCVARRDIGADEVPSGNPSCAPSVDTTAPDTTISALPIVRAKHKRVLTFFGLISTEANSTFRCSLDGSPYFPCANPAGLILRRGSHSLVALATDPAGNTDPTPARFVVTVLGKKRAHPQKKPR